MGKLSNRDFWTRPEPKAGGSLQPVGAMAARPRATATSICRESDGFWYYTEEIEVNLWPNRFLEVEFEGRHLVWMGLEVKSDDMSLSGKDFAFALSPYSLDWFGHARFRKAAKTKADMQRALRKALDKSGDLSRALQEIACDPFETNRKILTARLTSPVRMDWAATATVDSQYAYGRSINYSFGANSKHFSPTWMFGICDNFAQAAAGIREELQSDPKLYRQLPMDLLEIFDSTLDAAIQKALAGRHGGDEKKRVSYTVLRIMNQTMEAAGKRKGSVQR